MHKTTVSNVSMMNDGADLHSCDAGIGDSAPYHNAMSGAGVKVKQDCKIDSYIVRGPPHDEKPNIVFVPQDNLKG